MITCCYIFSYYCYSLLATLVLFLQRLCGRRYERGKDQVRTNVLRIFVVVPLVGGVLHAFIYNFDLSGPRTPRSKYIHASCKSSKFGCFHLLLLLSPVVKIPTKTTCLSLGGRPYSHEAVLANLKTVHKWDAYAYFRPRPCPYVPFLVIVHDKLLDLPVRDQSCSLGFRAPTETVTYLLVSSF